VSNSSGGVDFKYLIVPEGDRLPFDFAAQAAVGMLFGSGVRELRVPVGVLGSKSIPLDDGREITPFASAYVIIDRVSVDIPGGGDSSDTDMDVEIRLGAAAEVVGRTNLFAALHVGSGTMFFLGFTVAL
jgi:hypothetical protein